MPVEFDDFRTQLEKLTESLQPTQPGGVSTFGAFVNTAADNLRGQGTNIRDTLIKLSASIFRARRQQQRPLRHRQEPVDPRVGAARQPRPDAQLNQNLAATTALIANEPNEVGQAITDINGASATSQLSSPTTASRSARRSDQAYRGLQPGREHRRHQTGPARLPHAFQNFLNIYQPAHGAFDRRAGRQPVRQSDPIPLRGNPSRLTAGRRAVRETLRAISGADHQEPPINFLAAWVMQPVFVGPQARPERNHVQRGLVAARLRSARHAPRLRETSTADSTVQSSRHRRRAGAPLAPPEAPDAAVATNPADGLPGMMVPGGGS